MDSLSELSEASGKVELLIIDNPKQLSKLGIIDDLEIVEEFLVVTSYLDFPKEPYSDPSDICLSIFIFVNLIPNSLLNNFRDYS